MTALEVFRDYLVRINANYRVDPSARARVLAVWSANNCPLIVSCPDPRHDDDLPVYFVFQLTESGPTFTIHYSLTLAEALECPPTIAAIGATAEAAATNEPAPIAESPLIPGDRTSDARSEPNATLTAN